MPKYIFFTGGVASSIGKGVAAASLGAVLEARGLSVAIAKLDPYINVDPGTMNPNQHGEIFVTSDGAETDLDLGHYERYLNRRTSQRNNCTAGQIYERVIRRERAGGYLGDTVQVIPHITNEIKDFIRAADTKVEIVIIEIGGTVGDIESQPFLEAIRQMRLELPRDDTCFVHMTLVPTMATAGEVKTKPTQHSVRELREIGIQADVLLCRATMEISVVHRQKIALFANLHIGAVFGVPDVDMIYTLPEKFAAQGIDEIVCKLLQIDPPAPALEAWHEFTERAQAAVDEVIIGFVGKYGNPNESYKSLVEALVHAGIHTGHAVRFVHLDLDELVAGDFTAMEKCDAVLVPGAFGSRGIEGKQAAIRRARETDKPYLGICIGMQLALVEYARNELGLTDANSLEFDADTQHAVVTLEQGQNGTDLGGTLRLGSSACKLEEGSKLQKIYANTHINERHRHRYEFNNDYREHFEKKGLVFSGWSADGRYCEAIELRDHPFFIATQFHPEYESTPMKSHPLFKSFIKAARSTRA